MILVFIADFGVFYLTIFSYYNAFVNINILADDAIFNIATIYDKYLSDNTKAMEYYQKIMNEHPGSTYVTIARQRFRILRGDNISKEELFLFSTSKSLFLKTTNKIIITNKHNIIVMIVLCSSSIFNHIKPFLFYKIVRANTH